MGMRVLYARLRATLGAFCIASVAFSAPLAAQASEWDTEIWVGFEFQGETDLKEGPGEFDFWMLALGARARRGLDERATLVLKGDYRAIGYDFDNMLIGEPWETVHVLRLQPHLRVRLNDDWFLVGGPNFELSGETSADASDSARGGASFGVGYRHGENLEVVLGLIVQSEIEDDTYVAPLINVRWGIADGLRLSLESESSRGGELRLGYSFLDDFEVAIGGGFRRERFRLDDDRIARALLPPSRQKDGVGQEEATILSAHFAWAFTDHPKLETYLGSTIDGEFRLEDKRGHKIADRDYDNALFGGLRLRYSF